MCGIIGYIGHRPATPLLLDGLRRLEYRGYDSSGIALMNGDGIKVMKRKGRLAELEALLSEDGQKLESTVGIGHTRWATHGVPNDINAHPHFAMGEDLVLIHNGIIENFSELKEYLVGSGYSFQSDTDTEVLANLILEFYEGDLLAAVTRALLRVEGTYGIVVMHKNHPRSMVVARKGSPLVVGVGKDEIFVASDLAAMVEHTRDVIFLDDNEIGIVEDGEFNHFNLDHSPIKRKTTHIDFSLEQIEKGGYSHFMYKEIMEQPQTLMDTMRGRILDDGSIKLGGLIQHMDELAKAERILFLACGTSYHAGLVGEYLIEELAGIPVEVEYASEFRYRKPVIPPNTVAFAISQSGETLDTLEALREAQSRGALALAVVNSVGSTIARESVGGVYLHAGPEIGVASTKAFTSQVTVLVLIALLLRQQRMGLDEMSVEITQAMRQLPEKATRILEDQSQILDIAKMFCRASNFLYLGRGTQYPVALEGALKLKEISYIHAEGYPAAEMKHGPIALIDRNMPVFVLAAENSTSNRKILSNTQEVRARDGVVIALVTEGDTRMDDLANHTLYIPTTHRLLVPLLAVLPLQLLSYHVADLLGLDMDKPRNLAKSVTVE
ncbi:MAG TPA: glutamine--fructose-6-phosphate transaminase (isomerizing) [Bacteroidetes bacterium]|nr:glutamine--fructose-6-phosphate aminotransferase [isomerizing] [bacterium BMS3Bbin04]HDO66189.1 glutamine--fructose-6-phosphate transaminase (isomerizing) [Bacteroidota bacterium]HEX05314.1 glutamine--fructose-6-phosphate transaminase (isomerizing) [Bacteroidota bacterium]